MNRRKDTEEAIDDGGRDWGEVATSQGRTSISFNPQISEESRSEISLRAAGRSMALPTPPELRETTFLLL